MSGQGSGKMFGVTKKNAAFTVIFMLLTAGAIGMEIYGAIVFNNHTTTWTQLITSYVPEPIIMGAIGLLGIWLPVHFAEWIKARRNGTTAHPSQYATVLMVAIGAGLAAAQTAAGDGVVSRAEWRQILIVSGLAVVAYFVRDAKPAALPPNTQPALVGKPQTSAPGAGDVRAEGGVRTPSGPEVPPEA